MRLRAPLSLLAPLFLAATTAHLAAAQAGWRSLAPDTIGRLIIQVDVSAAKMVRVSVDTAQGKTPIVTGELAADSVEVWAKTVEATVADTVKAKVPSVEYRLGEAVMMSRDSTTPGHEYKLIVADSTGEQTFAVMVPPTHVARITTAIARATRPTHSGSSGSVPAPQSQQPGDHYADATRSGKMRSGLVSSASLVSED